MKTAKRNADNLFQFERAAPKKREAIKNSDALSEPSATRLLMRYGDLHLLRHPTDTPAHFEA
jgi:hypothetical protein